jgi:carbamoyl-phosphate synthase large subunit
MNVLLTCAGRRNYLIEYFRSALAGRGAVFAADVNCHAPAMLEADRSFVVEHVSEPEYVDQLLAICQKNRVRLLVPLNDLELPILAEHRGRFAGHGILVCVSPPRVVELCFDKWAAYRFLQDRGLPVPKTFLSVEEARAAVHRAKLAGPVVLKPRWGSASVGILYVDAADDLARRYDQVREQVSRTSLAGQSARDPDRSVIIQECIIGQEYGLDVINDLAGRYAATLVRRKLAMRAGETDASITVQDEALTCLGARIGQALAHIGNLDCDVIVTMQGPGILDLNPRFGGGYPFSHVAGADLPAALLAWAEGNYVNPSWLRVRPNLLAAKCDRLVVRRDPEKT